MDADEALALLRLRNRYIRELPSGLWARIALPQVGEILASGEVPMPVLREMSRQAAEEAAPNGDGPKEPAETNVALIAEMHQYRRIIVRRTLRGLATSQANLPDEDVEYPFEVIDELDQADYDQIFAWGDRNEPINPLPATPASLS